MNISTLGYQQPRDGVDTRNKDLTICRMDTITGLGLPAVELGNYEAWPCICSDPGHAIEDDGCFECRHGRWEFRNNKWTSWYWGDSMLDDEVEKQAEETSEQTAARLAAQAMKFRKMEILAKQQMAVQKIAGSKGKIMMPCKWVCYGGVYGALFPSENGWKAGCSVEGCKFVHPTEPEWKTAVANDVAKKSGVTVPAWRK
jgi:hypothetical protein